MSGTPVPDDQTTPYQQPVETVLASLGTDARRGLSEAEAQARLVRHGRNELAAEEPVPRWRRFLAQFGDALVILLLVAAVISLGLWLVDRESAPPFTRSHRFAQSKTPWAS